jgi:ubiquinone/menaquinone biosynthesis C-methylase UbiE
MQITERFSGRSTSYVKHRPSYPVELLTFIQEKLHWSNDRKIADIGAGTGIFTALLLEQGYTVVAVEPNDDMRHELLQQLQRYLGVAESKKKANSKPQSKRLTVINGSAESTSLADGSVDGIVCAQSFHWFDVGLARAEFKRVLVPHGEVVLVWNQRDVDASPFMQGYEDLFMQYGEQYDKVKHKQVSVENLTPFYGGKLPTLKSFYYEQSLDLEGLIGRIASSSFSLTEQDSRYTAFIAQIHKLFTLHEQHGQVTMKYRTDVYWGRLN